MGLEAQEALVLARGLITRLREADVSPADISSDDGALDVLHAALEIVAGDGFLDANGALEDASRLHQFISAADWPGSILEEKTELLGACSLWTWRLARKAGKPGLADVWAVKHSAVMDDILAVPAIPDTLQPSFEINQVAPAGGHGGVDFIIL